MLAVMPVKSGLRSYGGLPKKWKAEELWRQVMLEKYRIYEEL